jgi:hypothetical protein
VCTLSRDGTDGLGAIIVALQGMQRWYDSTGPIVKSVAEIQRFGLRNRFTERVCEIVLRNSLRPRSMPPHSPSELENGLRVLRFTVDPDDQGDSLYGRKPLQRFS